METSDICKKLQVSLPVLSEISARRAKVFERVIQVVNYEITNTANLQRIAEGLNLLQPNAQFCAH